MLLCFIIIQIKRNEMLITNRDQNSNLVFESSITNLYNCTGKLYMNLTNTNILMSCNKQNGTEVILNYDKIESYSFLINGSVFISNFATDMQQLDRNIATIAKSIYFNTTKYAIFNNIDDISNISTYAKLFNYPDIELWINVSDDCIWMYENNLTKYWDSKRENTRWRKSCFRYFAEFPSSFLHFSIDDDEVPGKVTVIQKKDFITIIIVVCVVLFVLIVSLYIVGYYCPHRSFDYPSA